MRARARPAGRIQIPPKIEPYTRQRFVTAGKEYEIHAIQVNSDGVPFFQFVDDLGYPAWQPYLLFDVMDTSLPGDWHCNAFSDCEGGTLLAIGPDFVVKDETVLADMVQLDADQVDRFWKRVDSLEVAADDADEV
jgi:hypothetical protein